MLLLHTAGISKRAAAEQSELAAKPVKRTKSVAATATAADATATDDSSVKTEAAPAKKAAKGKGKGSNGTAKAADKINQAVETAPLAAKPSVAAAAKKTGKHTQYNYYKCCYC
jgi:hypothetical protein